MDGCRGKCGTPLPRKLRSGAMPAKVIDVQDTALEPHFLITGDKNAKADAKKQFNAYGQRPDKDFALSL